MTQEEKDLLLRDLLPRLQYGVKIHTWYGEIVTSDLNTFSIGYDEIDIEQLAGIKPYLRPMSSMTEDEREELFQIWKLGKENGSESVTKLLKEIFYKAINENYILKLATSFENWIDVMAWFNKKHFDYRGLIEKELAVKATEEMYD